jgi:uncharacterized protein (TIGR00269 family)
MSEIAQKCSACKRKEPFFSRVYSGERLCKRCFTESIERKIRATISKYKMLDFNDIVAVAVSGGKDSITLLEVMAKMQRKHPMAKLIAVTVDEGIKNYRDEALKITAATCKKLRVPHHIVSFKQLYGLTMDEIAQRIIELNISLTPCAFCGVLRRKAINFAALEVGANKVATGHTLDDEVQTSLLNIFHGDVQKIAVEGPVTGKVHPRLVQKVKPMCEVPERESALHAFARGFNFQSTPCPYAGQAMRNDIRGLLNRMEEKHAGTKYTVFQSIEKLRPAVQQLSIKGEFKECKKCREPSAAELCMACQLLEQIK